MSNKSVNTTYALSGVLTSVAGEAFVLASHSGGVGTIVALAAGAAVYSILKDTKREASKDFSLPAIPPCQHESHIRQASYRWPTDSSMAKAHGAVKSLPTKYLSRRKKLRGAPGYLRSSH